MKTNKNYVVGWVSKGNRIFYSNRAWSNNDKSGGIDTMTFLQAVKHQRRLTGKSCIYKIVKVK